MLRPPCVPQVLHLRRFAVGAAPGADPRGSSVQVWSRHRKHRSPASVSLEQPCKFSPTKLLQTIVYSIIPCKISIVIFLETGIALTSRCDLTKSHWLSREKPMWHAALMLWLQIRPGNTDCVWATCWESKVTSLVALYEILKTHKMLRPDRFSLWFFIKSVTSYFFFWFLSAASLTRLKDSLSTCCPLWWSLDQTLPSTRRSLNPR